MRNPDGDSVGVPLELREEMKKKKLK